MPEGRGDRGVDVRDRVVHGLGDGAVARVALAGAPQFREVHRLACVHVQHVADAVPEAQRVGGGVDQAGVAEALVLHAGAVQRALVQLTAAGGDDLLGHLGAEVGREALPLDGEHPVALEVAEGAVVGDDLEAVAHRLEAAARAVAAIRALTDEVGEHRRAVLVRQRVHGGQRPVLGHAGGLEQQRGEQLVLVAVHVDEPDRGVRLGLLVAVQAEPLDPPLLGGAPLAQIVDPDVAAALALHARDERRHDGLDGLQQLPAAGARLGQRMGEQVHDQLLVGLAARVDAHVRQRRGGKQPAQQVQRLRLHGPPARRLGLAGRDRIGRVHPRAHPRQRLRVGVEQEVHRRRVLGAQRLVAVVAVAATGHRRVVRDVARGLLQITGEPRPLQDLRQHVRAPLDRHVHPAELRDRVVPVADEDALEELRRPRALDIVIRGPARRERRRELVQEQPPQRPGIARVAREHRGLDRLREIHEREHRPVHVREVGGEQGAFV